MNRSRLAVLCALTLVVDTALAQDSRPLRTRRPRPQADSPAAASAPPTTPSGGATARPAMGTISAPAPTPAPAPLPAPATPRRSAAPAPAPAPEPVPAKKMTKAELRQAAEDEARAQRAAKSSPAAGGTAAKKPAVEPEEDDLLGHPPEGLPFEKALVSDCPSKIPPGKKFKWDLRGEIDLAQLVAWASATLCRPVVVPQNLRQQKVQIYAPGLIYAEEARRLFFSALTSMGLTVQPEGERGREVFTVIESNRAHELPVPLYSGDERPPSNDSFVTKMTRLQSIGVDDILQVLNRLKSKDGDIVGFGPSSTLIITDLAENVRRMERIIKQLDVAPVAGDKIWVVKLHNTASAEMATLLDKIFGQKAQPAGRPARSNFAQSMSAAMAPPTSTSSLPPMPEPAAPVGPPSVTQIIPEDRSNSIIVVANEKAYAHILALIRRLDAADGPLDTAGDRLHVYFLANATAEDISGTLSGLGIGVSGGRGRTGARPAGGAGGGQAGALFEGEVKVASDKATNSLIIVAGGRDYLTLRDIIRRLDMPRRQVFIEATILEISINKIRKLGISFHAGYGIPTINGQNSLLVGGSEPNSQASSLALNPAALSGLAAGLLGPNIPGAADALGLPAGRSVPAFGVFMQALQNNNDVNVISMPHILTSDNEKATIQVGQNVPFPGASFGGGLGNLAGAAGLGGLAGLGALAVPVQRQDVALKLEVTPHVNDSDFVRLEIDNEISDVAGTGALGPTTNKRTIKTTVVVRDQQSVVLGGLIKDKVSESVDKVPLLGDIPILGYLFKFTNKTVDKQNLLIILTPYVIKDPQDLRRIFERKVRERREFIDNYSAFSDERDYDAQVDFRRKRGLLEEINRSAVDAEVEARELRAAEASMQGRWPEGPVEPLPLPAVGGRGSDQALPRTSGPSWRRPSRLQPSPEFSSPESRVAPPAGNELSPEELRRPPVELLERQTSSPGASPPPGWKPELVESPQAPPPPRQASDGASTGGGDSAPPPPPPRREEGQQ